MLHLGGQRVHCVCSVTFLEMAPLGIAHCLIPRTCICDEKSFL